MCFAMRSLTTLAVKLATVEDGCSEIVTLVEVFSAGMVYDAAGIHLIAIAPQHGD